MSSPELSAILDFLRQHAPFDALAPAYLGRTAQAIQIRYDRAGTVSLAIGQPNTFLHIIRRGAVELRDGDGALVARLSEGEAFGYPSLLTHSPARFRAEALEDTLLYLLPIEHFDFLRAGAPGFDQFYNRAHAERVQAAVEHDDGRPRLSVPLRRLVRTAPITQSPTCSVQEAARVMHERRVSSLLLVENDRLAGIFTDRDLRSRVVAQGLAYDTPVRAVMTADPITIQADRPSHEALVLMSRHNVHHLPVLDGEVLFGLVSSTDLLREQTADPVFAVAQIWKQPTVDGLAAIARTVPDLFARLVETGAKANEVSALITAFTDAFTQRLIALYEADHGPAPCAYAWLAFGSQAREEQTPHSDQDHGLVFPDDASAEAQAWFAGLATFVSDGLHACGYTYCNGNVMATNPDLRATLSRWKDRFTQWIEVPEPRALMYATIFFDLRLVAGSSALADALHAHIAEKAVGNRTFLGTLAKSAFDFEPPLGFFRNFVLKKHGGQAPTLDLKLQGVVPIVDVARIHALASGVREVSTLDRLRRLGEVGTLQQREVASLRDAYLFIAGVRQKHQAQQQGSGVKMDNYVPPISLSAFEQRHLKDAFSVVRDAMDGLDMRYQTRLIAG